MSLLKFLKYPIFIIPAEIAHRLVIFALKNGLIPIETVELPRSLNVKFFNTFLRTPVGLAAGFDKNAEVIKQMLSFGFGFVEVGTVTKKSQRGNVGRRVMRLVDDEAVINRLGFNNKGIKYLVRQINTRTLNTCVFGVNIGRSKKTEDYIKDYTYLLREIYGLSNYIVLNISSPNTKGLRDLQNKDSLGELLTEVMRVRKSIDYAQSVPIMLKISPDISDETKKDIAELSIKYKIDGLIISNTTVSRLNLSSDANKLIEGGLSGKPLFSLSTQVLSDMYKLTNGKITLIGCGGISSGADAYEKIKAGASLVQLYTAMIYKGLKVVNKINLELVKLLEHDGFSNVSHAIGVNHR